MNKEKLIVKLACLTGYLLFAGFSAYFTASSLSLNLLNGTNLWLIFVLVLVVAALAGWCLTNAIVELQKQVGASRATFIFSIVGFLIFWGISFTTNVHYFFVEKHGYSILTKELTSAKKYIVENTTRSDKNIDDQKYIAQTTLTASVNSNIEAFEREIKNTMNGHFGFGAACVNILNSTEVILLKDSEIYGDKNVYVIFDDVRDGGDIGITDRNSMPALQTKYTTRMLEALNKKHSVIVDFYERQKKQNTELVELLETIEELEKVHLPEVLKDGSVSAFYKYFDQQDGRVISKMPEEFTQNCIVKSGDKIESYNVYPSSRMFDTMSVWGDIISGRLANMTMLQWLIIALIFDIVSFILFYLFRK